LSTDRGKEMEPLFAAFFRFIESRRVTVVMAAGNESDEFLDIKVPQKFGSTTNGIITVGAVKTDGTIYEETSGQRAGKAGSLSVFGPGEAIMAPGNGGLIGAPGENTGTSPAAAITVGSLYSLAHSTC
jgi:subtilisin family serine protease